MGGRFTGGRDRGNEWVKLEGVGLGEGSWSEWLGSLVGESDEGMNSKGLQVE